jgi:hypothetical protein
LRFDADGRLLQDEKVLASVDWADDGSFARIAVGDREYDLVRKKRTGWHFSAVPLAGGDAVCEFLPHQLHRGGRLKAGSTTLQLHGHPLHKDRWWFEGDGGLKIEAVATLPLDGRTADEARVARVAGVRGGAQRLEVDLELQESLGVLHDAPLLLAFGCWLIVQWDTFPMLVAGGGGGFVGGV